MIKSISLSVAAVMLYVSVMAVINCAMAGDKIKTSATSVRTKWHSIEVGDAGGHTIALYVNKQVYADDINGLKSTGVNKGILDMNFKTGKGTIKGYTVRTFSNGDKMFSNYEGQPVGKGHSKGTLQSSQERGVWKVSKVREHGSPDRWLRESIILISRVNDYCRRIKNPKIQMTAKILTGILSVLSMEMEI